MEIPVHRNDDEPLQELFMLLKSELKLDLKNIKKEQAKFWKQHPALVKAELLVDTHLAREFAALSPSLQSDLRQILETAPRLLEELLKMTVIPRKNQGHGWLRPAIGVVELSQSIIQAVPLSARKSTSGLSDGIAPFLQLPHINETVIKKVAPKHHIGTLNNCDGNFEGQIGMLFPFAVTPGKVGRKCMATSMAESTRGGLL